MRNNTEKYNPTGEIEIWKIYNDGREELHYSEPNMIVSGMGVALAHLLAGSGSDKAYDYQIRWFQIGVSGSTPGIGTYQLTSPLSSTNQYGDSSVVDSSSLGQLVNGTIISSGKIFVPIKQNNIQRVSKNSVRYTLYVPSLAANNLNASINEAGIFIHNIKKTTPPAPILVAYKYFNPIYKTSDFALVLKWTITF